jgi:hypothetical protein
MDIFKNFSVKLQATGLTAAAIAWMGAVVAIGIFGTGPLAPYALGMLIGGIALIIYLAPRS